MVPKLRQHENFLTSNFCIPGLVRIPNRTVMEALTPHCVLFSLWLEPNWSVLPFQVLKESTLIPRPLPLLPVLSSWGPPCWHQYACTQCARTGLLAAWHLQLYLHHKLTLKKYLTCQHDFGLHFYTEHALLDIFRARQQQQGFNRKRRKENNRKLSYIFSWRESWSSSSLETHCTTINPLFLSLLFKYARFQIQGSVTGHEKT